MKVLQDSEKGRKGEDLREKAYCWDKWLKFHISVNNYMFDYKHWQADINNEKNPQINMGK